MNDAIHNIHLQLKKLEEADERAIGIIEAQRYQIRALRDEVKRLTADVAKAAYTKRAPLPAARAGRIGDDR
ncbi:MAG: hypothetical protein A2213_08065 [Lysobacterales bacterium RIFOXYA1_FULL_68_6]|nr:MAG: hypothetical protein A2213_08065 [Xanthomonadales bacterium RIFOXYA1_FULL_68_6]